MISAEERHEKRHAEVLGRRMAYVEVGEGDPIVFLHGNPTSSYLWRNVIPHLEALGRCIAPDLVGMGDSDKLPHSGPGTYRFTEHGEHLDSLLDALEVTSRVILVVHDWGSALGFDWARRHEQAVAGVAFMEAILPMTWDDWPAGARDLFRAFRSPAGEQLCLEQNVFVEQVLRNAVIRELSEAEMDVYRRPYREPGESRRPTLTWPRELPIEGEPADVWESAGRYTAWLGETDVPKLFVNAEPGAILTGAQRELVRTWPNLQEVTVPGIHFVQEDSPDEIGRAVADWYREVVAPR